MGISINYSTDMKKDFPRIVFSEDQIQNRIKEVGRQIARDFADKQKDGILMVSVLKGAAVFMVDLMRACNLKLEIDFLVASSYNNELYSCGKVDIKTHISSDIAGKHIIVADDVVDSGKTLVTVRDYFINKGAASVTIVAFLHKYISIENLDVKYVCFKCPNEFIVGYGLDYCQYYRNMPYVSSLDN